MATALTAFTDTTPATQSTGVNFLSGSYANDDTDNHDFIVTVAGKARTTIHIRNGSDKVLTVQIYGAQDSASDPGEATAVTIGGTFTVAATTNEYETIADPFPYYLIRIVSASGPNGATVVVYANIVE